MNSHAKKFMDAVRGIEARHVTQVLSVMTLGINWNGCSKSHMAEAYGEAMVNGRSSMYPGLRGVDLLKLAVMAQARKDGRPWRNL